MKSYAETEIKFVDPLTFQTITEGERVTLKTDNGIVKDFRVVSIEKNDSIVLGPMNSQKPSLINGSSVGCSIEIRAFSFFQNRRLKTDEKVMLKVQDTHQPYWVDTILNSGIVILRPTAAKKKMGLLDRLFFLKRSISG